MIRRLLLGLLGGVIFVVGLRLFELFFSGIEPSLEPEPTSAWPKALLFALLGLAMAVMVVGVWLFRRSLTRPGSN